MNRKQRRAQAKAHRLALKRTQKYAKKLALKRGRTKTEANMEASAVSIAFRNEFWHPETPMGEALERFKEEYLDEEKN